MIDPPITLRGKAREKWDELYDSVTGRPAQKKSSVNDLAAYCAAFGRWAEAEAWLSEDGHGMILTIRDDKGNIKSHGPAPQVALSERSHKEMARLARVLKI